MTRKPMYHGLDFVRDKDFNPRLFTKAGAINYMRDHMEEDFKRCNFQVVVAEFSEYFRGSYAK